MPDDTTEISSVLQGGPPPGPLQLCAQMGFRYPVFISWPHRMQRRGMEIVYALAAGLEDRFRDEGGAEVFFDRERLKASYLWDEELRVSLCRSAVTIAILLRTYFDSDYCRTEWAISETLSRKRIGDGVRRSPIIPILLTKNLPLPREIGKIHYEDGFQELLVYGRDPTTHERWNQLIEDTADNVFELIDCVCATERDWAAEEQIARQAQPKQFTWRVGDGSGAPLQRPMPQARTLFPSLQVENSAG